MADRTAEEEALIRLATITRVEAYKRRGATGHTEKVSSYLRKVLDAAGFGSSKTKKGAYSKLVESPAFKERDYQAEDLEKWKNSPLLKEGTPIPKSARPATEVPGGLDGGDIGGEPFLVDKNAGGGYTYYVGRRRYSSSRVGTNDNTPEGILVRDDMGGQLLAAKIAATKDPDPLERNRQADRAARKLIAQMRKGSVRRDRPLTAERVAASADDEDPLVRLASITHVKGYKRRGDSGETERVNAYVRKVLDSFGGGDDKTKKGAFASTDTVDPNAPKPAPAAPSAKTPAPNAPGAPGAPTAKQAPNPKQAADLKADADDYSVALTDALNGKPVKVPTYRTSLDDAFTPDDDLGKASVGAFESATDEDLKKAGEALKRPEIQDLGKKTPIAVLQEAAKAFLADPKKAATHAFFVTMGLILGDTERFQEWSEKALGAWDWTDLALNHLTMTVPHFLPAVTQILQMPGVENFLHLFGYSDSQEGEVLGAPLDELAIKLAKGRLDWSPKKNWVESAGGLPKYIEDIALALIRDHGRTREHAIPVAINRVKKWAAGGDDVKPDTRAKAAAALAQWEALKAKSKAKSAVK